MSIFELKNFDKKEKSKGGVKRGRSQKKFPKISTPAKELSSRRFERSDNKLTSKRGKRPIKLTKKAIQSLSNPRPKRTVDKPIKPKTKPTGTKAGPRSISLSKSALLSSKPSRLSKNRFFKAQKPLRNKPKPGLPKKKKRKLFDSSFVLPKYNTDVFKTLGSRTNAGMNEGISKINQDSLFINTSVRGDSRMVLIAVFDGHGDEGHRVSGLLKMNTNCKKSPFFKNYICDFFTSL